MKKTQSDRELRRKAEEKVASQPVSTGEANVRRLLHELQVHQVELEMQNEELKRLNTALQEEKTYIQNVIDMTPAGYFRLDVDDCFVEVNDAFLHMHGYDSVDEIIGKHFSMMQIDSASDPALKHLDELHNGKSVPMGEFTSLHKDGSVGHHAFSAHPVLNTGRIVGFEWFIIDITDRVNAEQERLKLVNQLRQSQKMEVIGTLSGGIAHDFNNLLAIISSNIDLVQHKQKNGIIPDENVRNIKETVGRAKNLVSQILAFSRQEKHALSAVDLSIVIADSLKLLRSTIPVTIEILFEVESAPVFINADSTQIQQILINLCTNAVHAMDEKGLLRASLGKVESGSQYLPEGLGHQPGGYAKLSVSDTGCGIEKEHIDRIFDPFFTTKDVGMGTGMGLSAAYGIVEQHGGFITVDSTVGAGSTFNIFLPVINAGVEKPQIDKEPSLPTGTERILFVDDEECIAYTCNELLECQGYKVTSVTSGIEALDLFKANPEAFDLVFTDQTMPVMTGAELATELLKIRPDIPIILCSDYSAKMSESEAKGIGIRAFCMKPMDMKKLATVTREVLDEEVI